MPLLACPAVLFRENSRSLLDKPAVAPFSSTRHSKFDKALMPLPVDFGTFHTNPKHKRGRDLAPRLRFALSVSLDRERYRTVSNMD